MPAITLLDKHLNLTDQEFEQVSDLVYQHCGINLHDGKKELVRSRLAKLLRTKEMTNYSDYLAYVTSDTTGTAFSELIDAISTNLTSFFREPDHFDFLRNRYLPELLEKTSPSGQKIRAWSAGCSSGEEPYTIAITLLDAIPAAEKWDIKILATDISTRILKTAQQGIYDPERIEPVPAALKHRFLLHRKMNGASVYEVSDMLRERIAFKYLNLMNDFPFHGPFNFIFCRNVMIYFDKPTQQRLIERFWKVLSPGGLLFTGHSESLTGIKHAFHYVQPTIYRKG
jgi:chemotaxis protein methyltransferase CheR